MFRLVVKRDIKCMHISIQGNAKKIAIFCKNNEHDITIYKEVMRQIVKKIFMT